MIEIGQYILIKYKLKIRFKIIKGGKDYEIKMNTVYR